jgi:hypothetical protein
MGGRRGVGSWTARLGWLQAALLEAAARARGGGRLANRGGRRGRQWLGCKRERERERGNAAVGRRHVGPGDTVPGGVV